MSLVNTPSPSLASLGEVRRFSHTLGVLYLTTLTSPSLSRAGFTPRELSAFAASVLLHDVGTSAFAHLVEYHLRERDPAWDHEEVAVKVIYGKHAPENRAHQIFGGNTIQLYHELKRVGIPLDLVEQILRRKHPLGNLLAGTLDLDNLDNVSRMAWALGIDGWAGVAPSLASTLSIDRSGRLLLSTTDRKSVETWSELRRRIYTVLTFDPTAIAAQAVLSESIGYMMDAGELTKDDWCMTDEKLLEQLQSHPSTKHAIVNEYYGHLPLLVFFVQLRGVLADYHLRSRTDAKRLIEQAMNVEMPQERGLGYAVSDSGTFAKALRFVDPATNEEWVHGTRSTSIILYGFNRSRDRVPKEKCNRVLGRVLKLLSANNGSVMRYQSGSNAEPDHAQPTFDWPSP